jgi:cyclophilin family peptidyl-prolyl cis-trans isomerase
MFGCAPGGGRPSEDNEDESARTSGKTSGRSKEKPSKAATKKGAAATSKQNPVLKQSFAEATISADDAPDGQVLPDKTFTGKSVGTLYSQVKDLWDKVPLVTPGGKHLTYRAILDTDLGTFEIDFRPDIAPNHVRNFVALARAGYYDGLLFERKHHEVAEDDPRVVLEYLEAGCPMGTGEENFGSIGYWMKPEFNEKIHHEEGTVGAWHSEEADTAACKFYITLTKAPFMDGNFTVFGKVSKGLDVVRQIAKQPLREEDEFKDRPKVPVMIKKVTIQARELD